MPGVYTFGKVAFDETGARTIKPVTKIRGGDAKKYAAKVNANQWLIENVLAAWRKPFDPRKPETFPRIVAGYQKYITVGNALASRARWKLAGRWRAASTSSRPAHRCLTLATRSGLYISCDAGRSIWCGIKRTARLLSFNALGQARSSRRPRSIRIATIATPAPKATPRHGPWCERTCDAAWKRSLNSLKLGRNTWRMRSSARGSTPKSSR